MARSDDVRSAGATIVGWLFVVIIALVVLRFLASTLGFVFRSGLFIILILGLIWVYFRLRAGSDDDE